MYISHNSALYEILKKSNSTKGCVGNTENVEFISIEHESVRDRRSNRYENQYSRYGTAKLQFRKL